MKALQAIQHPTLQACIINCIQEVGDKLNK